MANQHFGARLGDVKVVIDHKSAVRRSGSESSLCTG